MKKLLVVGIEHPNEIGSWSGIPYHLAKALDKHFDLYYVGGLSGPFALWHRIKARAYRLAKFGNYRPRSEPQVLREFSARVQQVIDRHAPDAILSVACEPIAYLNNGVPAFMIHDSTFRQISSIYDYFVNLCARSKRTGEDAQIRGFDRASLTFAASNWARESAIRDYGIPPEKVKVIPMGANILDAPDRHEVEEVIGRRRQDETLNFLFVGVDWSRKGGDTALRVVEALVNRGVSARLVIVGCVPPKEVLENPLTVSYGFLSKKNVEDAQTLQNLYKNAAFFIVPSVAECYGCVFCEASAFGVPSIARAVGGIIDIIQNGITGFMISENFPESEVIEALISVCRDENKYREMALRARSDFETRLNWESYSLQLRGFLDGELSRRG